MTARFGCDTLEARRQLHRQTLPFNPAARKTIMDKTTIKQLRAIAGALAQASHLLTSVLDQLGAPAETSAPKKIGTTVKAKPATENSTAQRGRKPAPRVQFKIKREHWSMNFSEFKNHVRSIHPTIPGAQIGELIEELRAIKEAKGIEIKRGRAAAQVEDAKIVKETKRVPKVEPKPTKKKTAPDFDFSA